MFDSAVTAFAARSSPFVSAHVPTPANIICSRPTVRISPAELARPSTSSSPPLASATTVSISSAVIASCSRSRMFRKSAGRSSRSARLSSSFTARSAKFSAAPHASP